MATRKRPAPKKQTSPVVSKSPPMEPKTRSVENNTSPRRRTITYVLLALVVIGGLLYAFRTQLLAATVNDEMITRWKLIRELEKQNGAQVLDSLITETLVMQEAKKKGVSISEAELAEELKKIEERFTAQGQNLDEVLKMQGYSKEDLRRQVMLQKLVEKMTADKVTITDEEVVKYITDNKQFLQASGSAEQKTEATEQLRQEKISQESQQWIEELKNNSDIKYYRQ